MPAFSVRVARSHSFSTPELARLSELAEARVWPSGEKASGACPRNVARQVL